MLILVLAEAALETIPEQLWSHPSVRSNSKRQRKPPKQLLLDRSLHHSAMVQLDDNKKRGRPDIAHFTLIEALGSPLNKEGLLRTYVHTKKDYLITVNPNTRLPRNYNRFLGLMEQLFQQQKVPTKGETLLRLEHKTLRQLFKDLKVDYILAFSRKGTKRTIQDAVSSFKSKRSPVVIVGGFPHGDFSETTLQLANEVVSVDVEMLDAWTVASRAIYEYEQLIALPKKRTCEN